MKFSVLLPTRNGAKYVSSCIHSILDQDYSDMELVVYDNANTDGTDEVVKSFGSDSRLKYFRTNEVVSVTQNWNNSLLVSSGDYVLMVGDDDYLLPGYFRCVDEMIEQYKAPDAISYSGYVFIYPHAIDDDDRSYYSDPHFKYGRDLTGNAYVGSDTLNDIVYDMFKFRNRVPLNTIPHIWSRRLINRVDGDLFRPPYPDHFALNALLLKADNWIFSDDKLYVIGVTPKSYGHYVFSDDEQETGESYLGISGDFPGQLPGNALVNNMYVWLELLKQNFVDELASFDISRTNYVRHQVHFWISQYRHGSIVASDLFRLVKLLSLEDIVGLVSILWDKRSLLALWAMIKREPKKIETFYYGPSPLVGVRDASEFSRYISDFDEQ